VWQRVYGNAWTNMHSDVEAFLQQKFFVNQKLISRETSEFSSELNEASGLAGVQLQFDLPRYGRIHILSLEIWAAEATGSPGLLIQVFDKDENGDVLYETHAQLEEGKNQVFIDQDFESDKIFIAVDPEAAFIRGTDARRFAGCFDYSFNYCYFPCLGGNGYVRQINGGGLNVIYNVICSSEKFLCQNLNLFRKTFWWKVGQELIIERRYGNRLNEFTTMTQERAEELTEFYQAQYTQSLGNSLNSHNIYEDPVCFECKGVVGAKPLIP